MIKLKEHQAEVLPRIRNGTIIHGGVGSGKSLLSLFYYIKVCGGDYENNIRIQKPLDLYIITTAKKRDDLEWEKELLTNLYMEPWFIVGSDHQPDEWQNIKVYIDSWQNIKKYQTVKNSFFIFDENKAKGSGLWSHTFLILAKHNKWIKLTATPGDTWNDYIPIFIANGFYKNRTQFHYEHCVFDRYSKFPKIIKFINEEKLLYLKNKVLVKVNYKSKNERQDIFVDVNYDKELIKNTLVNRWNFYENKPIANIREIPALLRKITNSDKDRCVQILNLIKKHRIKKALIFYNFSYELEALKNMCDENNLKYTQYNGKVHDDISSENSWYHLVQYSAAEAWNCITTNNVIFYSLNYSWSMVEQAKGRIDRLDSPFDIMYYYILKSNSIIDTKIMERLETKQTFNEKEFILDLAHSTYAIIEERENLS